MRSGFTTGSCAAAAAKAACMMLFSDRKVSHINIITPKGTAFETQIEDITINEGVVSCCVVKDGGDDPDITTGAKIFATASLSDKDYDGVKVKIVGGKGVGVVTKPGLDQPIGEYAINSVPRNMIRTAVEDVCETYGVQGEILIVISVPNGETIAKNTFNPRLGIEGGISIIGTSGVVEPMSSKAILDTIFVELRQKKSMGWESVVITPGNYGQRFLKEKFGYDIERSVKCSNFIGETIDSVCELDFKKMLLIGHIGKLVKIAGGIMNTHSREADCRMEIISSAAVLEGAGDKVARGILKCSTTQEAIDVLKNQDTDFFDNVMDRIMNRIVFYLDKRAEGKVKIDCIMFSNENGILATSKGAKEWYTLLGQEAEA